MPLPQTASLAGHSDLWRPVFLSHPYRFPVPAGFFSVAVLRYFRFDGSKKMPWSIGWNWDAVFRREWFHIDIVRCDVRITRGIVQRAEKSCDVYLPILWLISFDQFFLNRSDVIRALELSVFVTGRNDILAIFWNIWVSPIFQWWEAYIFPPVHAGARNKCETVFGLLTTTAILSLHSQILFGREHLLQYLRPPP